MAERAWLLFLAGNLPLAADASVIRAIHHDPLIEPLSACRSWFCGFMRTGSRLLPVTDLGALFDAPFARGPVLELDPALAIAGLRVERICGFRVAGQTASSPDSAEAGTLARGLPANAPLLDMPPLRVGSNRHWPVDIERLLASERFLDIGPGPLIEGVPA